MSEYENICDEPLPKKLRCENNNQQILENAKNLNNDTENVLQKSDDKIKKITLKNSNDEKVFKFTANTTPPTQSPRKRLNIPSSSSSYQTKEVFRYGNYSRYYNYRNQKDFQDIRLAIFAEQKHLFMNNEILDIGCNSGLITIEISKKLNIKNIIGIDIDKSLINKVTKYIEKQRKYFNDINRTGFPFNIKFIYGNYVLRDDILLEIETEQFDVILCLSVTKWIHLNFGDAGLKQAFKRMFLQLRSGGKLILEAQPWSGYKRRKKLTAEIFENYKMIKFFPNDFTEYLLGSEIGFNEVKDLGVPEHCVKGFRRPIQIFYKK